MTPLVTLHRTSADCVLAFERDMDMFVQRVVAQLLHNTSVLVGVLPLTCQTHLWESSIACKLAEDAQALLPEGALPPQMARQARVRNPQCVLAMPLL